MRSKALWLGWMALASTAIGAISPNLVVPPGFRLGLFAGPEAVPDARALAVHENGAVLAAGPGYVRVLPDLNLDGVADGVAEFAPPPEPGAVPSALWAEPGFVYWVGDGGVWRYVDLNRDGVADGGPARLVGFPPGPGRAQSLVRGPDGWWYLSGSSGVSWGELSVRGLPADGAREGGVVRVNPTFDAAEWLAGGMNTARRIAFNSWGELFVVDEGESHTVPLSWQTGAGMWHLARGARHGWGRTTSRPDYYIDQTPALAGFGPARLTGLVSYRHYQFPPRYRDGLFGLDWSGGRVWFVPLQQAGSSYAARPEVFVDSVGPGAFTPIDAVVAPDGSLLVASGDRKTRGGIYRVQHVADPAMLLFATNWVTAALTPLRAVLTAPEPLAAWSRSFWVPTAVQLGRAPFEVAVGDRGAPAQWRTRAIEVLTEVFGGLTPEMARQAAREPIALVRARTAWSLGRAPCGGCAGTLIELARDPDVAVRRMALEAVLDQVPLLGPASVQGVLTANLGHPERRLRQLAARLASYLPEDMWTERWSELKDLDPTSRLTLCLALLWRQASPADQLSVLDPALDVVADKESSPERVVEALRLVSLALQDWSAEPAGYAGFVAAGLLPWTAEQQARVLGEARGRLSDENPAVARESARLLAMLADDRTAVVSAVLSRAAEGTSEPLHYLAVLARLQGPVEDTTALAETLLGLSKRSEVVQRRGGKYWPPEVIHLFEPLLARHPGLGQALVRQSGFAVPANLDWVFRLGPSEQEEAARRFLAALRENPVYPWSPELVRLLGRLPAAEVAAVLRPQWRQPHLREEIVRVLARAPNTLDREPFIWGLGSADMELVRTCLDALMTLPKVESTAAIAAGAHLMDRLIEEPGQFLMRAQVLRLMERETGRTFEVQERGTAPEALREAYQPVFRWLAAKYPTWGRHFEAAAQMPPWRRRVQAAGQLSGDPARGRLVFQQRGCMACHHGPAALGPDLGTALRERSGEDVFRALFFPDERIEAAFRPTRFRNRDGRELVGIVAWQNAQGTIVNTGPNETLRLAWREVAEAAPSPTSLMPKNLLEGMSPRDLADLQAFLRGIGR